jgi:Na+/melibiose symporter-like transporter
MEKVITKNSEEEISPFKVPIIKWSFIISLSYNLILLITYYILVYVLKETYLEQIFYLAAGIGGIITYIYMVIIFIAVWEDIIKTIKKLKENQEKGKCNEKSDNPINSFK